MITRIKTGAYKLIETKANIKIPYLDNQPFAWISTEKSGHLLVWSHVPHKADRNLAMGVYCIYDVDEEPYLTDLWHIELQFGRNAWQGYMLPTGLPDETEIRKKLYAND